MDQNYIGKIKYEVSQYLNVNADAGYNVSNRPDRDIDLTGLVQSNNRRKRQSYGLGADYELTQYSAMAVFFKYSKDEFDGGNILNQDQKDYRTGLNFVHDLSQLWEETTGRFNIQFEKFDFETSDADNYFATIGMKHKFSSGNQSVDRWRRCIHGYRLFDHPAGIGAAGHDPDQYCRSQQQKLWRYRTGCFGHTG